MGNWWTCPACPLHLVRTLSHAPPTRTVHFGAAQDNQASPSLNGTLSPDQLSPEPPLPAAHPLTPASTLTRPGRLLRSFEVDRLGQYPISLAP